MKKAWSLFWLFVASVIAFHLALALIEPYIGLIAGIFIVVVVLLVGYKVYRFVTGGRTRYR